MKHIPIILKIRNNIEVGLQKDIPNSIRFKTFDQINILFRPYRDFFDFIDETMYIDFMESTFDEDNDGWLDEEWV